ncbi:MAG: DUF1934 family protein [Clostridia bacterium]|nr:DUF1934 family protein [Clostridia bacterium]
MFRAAGRLRLGTDGLISVHYPQENGETLLTLREEYMEMQRSGDTELFARFASGETSVMRMRIGEGVGEVPLDTQDYRVRRSKNGWRALLRYRLLFAEGGQAHDLLITIWNSEEK